MQRPTTSFLPTPYRLAAATALALALAAGSAGAAELRWKFKAGDVLRYEMEQKTVTDIKANGQEVNTTLTQTIDTTWTVASVADDGTGELSQRIDRVRTKVDSNAIAFAFDSDEDKAVEGPLAEALVPTLKALVGATFRYKMSPRGELTDVRVPDGLVEKLKEVGPKTGGNLGMYSEEGLKNMIKESSLSLPADALAIGKSWTIQSKVLSPPIGTLVLDKTYRYEGPAREGERIGLEVGITLEPAPGGRAEVKIGEQEGKGYFLFDNEAGRVAESSVREKVQMLIKATNQELSQTIDTSTVMKLVKDGPVEPKPSDAP